MDYHTVKTAVRMYEVVRGWGCDVPKSVIINRLLGEYGCNAETVEAICATLHYRGGYALIYTVQTEYRTHELTVTVGIDSKLLIGRYTTRDRDYTIFCSDTCQNVVGTQSRDAVHRTRALQRAAETMREHYNQFFGANNGGKK